MPPLLTSTSPVDLMAPWEHTSSWEHQRSFGTKWDFLAHHMVPTHPSLFFEPQDKAPNVSSTHLYSHEVLWSLGLDWGGGDSASGQNLRDCQKFSG